MIQVVAFLPYVALASAVPLLAAVATRRLWPALLAGLLTLALAACVLPRWLADSDAGPAATGGPTLRVLSANLLMGRADPAALVAAIRAERVDLLAMQEFTAEARDGLSRAGLDNALPYRVTHPRDGVGGSALYSRFPLSDGRFRLHVVDGMFGQASATVTVPGAAAIAVESVHPCAPSDRDRTRCWRADLADQPAATVHATVRLLIGDFNATLDHAPLRHLIGTGYRDAADVVGAGLVATWPFDDRWYVPKVTIDHVLADRRIGVRRVSATTLPRSDHRMLFAELVLPPG